MADIESLIDKFFRAALEIGHRADLDHTYKADKAADEWGQQVQAAADGLKSTEEKIGFLGVLAGRLEGNSDDDPGGSARSRCGTHASRIRDAAAIRGLLDDVTRH